MARNAGLLQEDGEVQFEILEDIHEKSETLPKGVIMRVRGMFAQADKVTANGTLYKKTLWEREAERIKPQLESRSVLMLSDHPKRKEDGSVESPSVRNVIGGLTSLSVLPDGKVMGEAELADTAAGRDAAAIVRAGLKLGTSSRARGTFTETQLEEATPLAAANPDYVGQKVKVVDDNFQFRSFDLVVEQSVAGAKIDDFQEEETIEMDLNIEKLTEKEWEKVLGSDKVKALVEGKIKEQEAALRKEFEEVQRKDTQKMTEEYLQSDKFLERFEGKLPPEFLANIKGKKGKKKGEKGEEDDEGADEGANEGADDGRFALLEQQMAEIKAENAKLVEDAKRAKDRERVAAILEESLKGKPAHVAEKVRGEVAKRGDLTEEDARAFVKDRIELVEGIFKLAEASVPAGKGVMMGGDRAEPKPEEKPLTEQERALKSQVGLLTSL